MREPNQVLIEAPIARVENGDRYGYALVSADFNGDGFGDLAVGAPWEDWAGANDTGLVFVFMGTSEGLESSFGCQYYFIDQSPRGANEAGDRFGYALAVGDVNGNGRPDLVIGAPYEDRPETRISTSQSHSRGCRDSGSDPHAVSASLGAIRKGGPVTFVRCAWPLSPFRLPLNR